MIGSQHYRTAESYLAMAERAEDNGDFVRVERELHFAEVHASLANAAAVALAATFEPSDGETAQAWRRTIQVPRPILICGEPTDWPGQDCGLFGGHPGQHFPQSSSDD